MSPQTLKVNAKPEHGGVARSSTTAASPTLVLGPEVVYGWPFARTKCANEPKGGMPNPRADCRASRRPIVQFAAQSGAAASEDPSMPHVNDRARLKPYCDLLSVPRTFFGRPQ